MQAMRICTYSISLLMLFCCLTAHATTLRHRSLPELVDASDLIVVGQTEKPESFWQDTRIVTRAKLKIEEVWVGHQPKMRTVEVWTLGGVVGRIGQHVDGMVTLKDHQRAVWQLARGHNGVYWPVALSQGVWFIDDSDPVTPKTSSRAQAPGSTPAISVRRTSTAHLVGMPADSLNQTPQTLGALKAAILEAAHGR